jgi:hypothetical protein
LSRIKALREEARDKFAMRSRIPIPATLLAAMLGACASEQPAKGTGSPRSDEATCVSYGFVPGTTAYTNCLQREIDARRTGKIGPTYDQRLISPAEPRS